MWLQEKNWSLRRGQCADDVIHSAASPKTTTVLTMDTATGVHRSRGVSR